MGQLFRVVGEKMTALFPKCIHEHLGKSRVVPMTYQEMHTRRTPYFLSIVRILHLQNNIFLVFSVSCERGTPVFHWKMITQ